MNSEIGTVEVTCPVCQDAVVVPVLASQGQTRRQVVVTISPEPLRTHLLSHTDPEPPALSRRDKAVVRLQSVADVAAEMMLETEGRGDNDASMKWVAVHRKALQALGLLHGVKDE